MNILLLQDSITIFLGIVLGALPFILLGVIVSNLFNIFVKEETLLKLVPRNPAIGVLVGSLIGFIFPVCECGNIPVARRLLLKKVPPYLVITYLLASPVFNPIVIVATYVAFRNQPSIVVLRIVLSLIIACFVGFLMSREKNQESLLAKALHNTSPHPHDCCEEGDSSKLHSFLNGMIHEFFEIGGMLILGAFLAAFFQIIIPRSSITGIATGPLTSILAMIALASVISICSNVDAFFALGFSKTFTSGSLLAFLVFGPMIDIKTLIMLRTTFTAKTLVWLTALVALSTIAITLFMNLNIS